MIPAQLQTLAALFVALQVLDVALTVTIIHRGGVELNPFLPSHPGLHVVVKAIVVTAVLLDGRALPVATILTAVVVLWNVRQMMRCWWRRREDV